MNGATLPPPYTSEAVTASKLSTWRMLKPSTKASQCQQVYLPGQMELAYILRAFEGYGLGKVCMAGARGGKGGHAPQAKFYFYEPALEAFPRGWWDQDVADAGGYENTYPSIEAVGGCMTTGRTLFPERKQPEPKKVKKEKREKKEKDKKHKKAKREEPRMKEEEINGEVEEHVVAQPTEQRRPFSDEVVPHLPFGVPWGHIAFVRQCLANVGCKFVQCMSVITMVHATLLQLCFHFNAQDVVVVTGSGVCALRSQAQEPVAWAQWSATQASYVVGTLVQSSCLIGLTFTPLQGSPQQLALLRQLQTSQLLQQIPQPPHDQGMPFSQVPQLQVQPQSNPVQPKTNAHAQTLQASVANVAGPKKPTKEASAWIHSRHKETSSYLENKKEWGRSHGVDTWARRPAEEDAGVAETKKMIADMIAQDKANEKARQEKRDEKEQDKEKRRAEEQKRAKEAKKKKEQERQDRKHRTEECTAHKEKSRISFGFYCKGCQGAPTGFVWILWPRVAKGTCRNFGVWIR